MISFTQHSVRQKLIKLILLASALALLCVVAAVVFYEIRTFRPRTLAQLEAEAGVLEEVLASSLDFDLKGVAEKGLDKHCADRPIVLAALYGPTNLFATYQRPGAAVLVPSVPGQPGHTFTADRLSLWWPMHNNEGVLIGSLYLVQELPPFHSRLPQYGIMTAAVMLALAVVGFVLMRGLHQNVLRPLAALVRTTDQVIQRNDYSVRADLERKDELGDLAAAVNRMLEVIGQRDADLRLASTRIQNVFNAATEVGIISTDTKGIVTVFNTGAERMLGYRAEEVVGKQTPVIWHVPEECAARGAELTRTYGRPVEGFDVFVVPVRQGHHEAGEWTFVRKDGSTFRVFLVITAVRDSAGNIAGFLGMVSDITERKRAEAALAESRQLYEELVSSIPLGVYRLGIGPGQQLRFEYVSDRFCEVIGLDRAKVLNDAMGAFAVIHPAEREEFKRLNDTAISSRTPFLWEGRAVVHGRTRWLHIESRPTVTAERSPFWTGVAFDVTERKEAEEHLRQSQASLEEAQALALIGSWDFDVPTGEVKWSREMFRLHGRAKELGAPELDEFARLVHADDRERFLAYHQRLLRGDATEDLIYRTAPETGAERELRVQSAAIRNASGRVVRLRGTCADLTRQLQAARERSQLEEQLRQVQKMEAIGQLSGGVAHDFNNILTIIDGHVTLLRLSGKLNEEMQESVTEIGQATSRAANLTRQLLAFSRRQTMQFRTLNLNEVVANMTRMLGRILGEDVKMHLHYARQTLNVHVDAGMIEQVLLNLVVNARDAMPNGGRLIIETGAEVVGAERAAQMPEARPGPFALISVSDTGCGIAPEVLPKIFEPFFTTKDVGKGTGLGLATVYGIVQQHKGWVVAYSEVGIGTTFRVFIPLCDAAAAPEAAAPLAEPVKLPAPTASKETILLVEDEPALRNLGCKILRRLGYVVLEAPTGVVALEVWRRHRGQIRLLLTDIVMPDGMSGMELARRLQRDEPRLPVIYTSGYSAEIAGREFPLQEGVNFLAKPFNPAALAEVVRTSLDGREA